MTSPLLWPWPADDPRRFKRMLVAADLPVIDLGDGRRGCRWCGADLKRAGAKACSPTCVTEVSHRMHPQVLAWAVWERDGGLCALCGDITELPLRLLLRTRHTTERIRCSYSFESRDFWTGIVGALERQVEERFASQIAGRFASLPYLRHVPRPWEADHVVPVSEGGGCCGLDGMRTLCRACHNSETAALRRRLSARRRSEVAA